MAATATIGTWAIQAEDAPAQIGRLLTNGLMQEGVIDKANDSFKVAQNTGSDMNIKVGSGTVGDLCVIAGDAAADQGLYIGQHGNSTQTLAVAASDPTNDRIDRVIARVYDDDADSSGNSYMDLEVITGTPAGSPSAPALPDGAITLATILVQAAVTAITNSDITDARSEALVTRSLLGHDLRVTNPADEDTSATGSWVDWGNVIDFGNPGREVIVRADATCSVLGDSASSGAVRLRIEISLDGGSTWDNGQGPWTNWEDAVSAMRRLFLGTQHLVSGTPTGAVQVKVEYQQSGGSAGDVQMQEGTLIAEMIPYDS